MLGCFVPTDSSCIVCFRCIINFFSLYLGQDLFQDFNLGNKVMGSTVREIRQIVYIKLQYPQFWGRAWKYEFWG